MFYELRALFLKLADLLFGVIHTDGLLTVHGEKISEIQIFEKGRSKDLHCSEK